MSSVSKRDLKRAIAFLKDLLGRGPLLAQDVYHWAHEEDVSKAAVQAAREKLGIKPYNINDRSPFALWQCWMWSLRNKPAGTTSKDDALRKERTENLQARGILPKEALYTTSTTPPKRSKRYWDNVPAWDGKTPPWLDQR